MTGIHAAIDRDPAHESPDPSCCVPCPENGDCDPMACSKFLNDEWERGQCYNCGRWARSVPGQKSEYEWPNCGDIWNIYEPSPEIP